MRTPAMWLSILTLVGAVSGCSYPGAPTKQDPTADERHAAYEIAAARCDRRTPACESGTPLQGASREMCVEAKLAKSVTEAGLVACEYYGLNERQLRSCVQRIRQGQCGSGVTRIQECQGAKLCPYEAEEGTSLNVSEPPATLIGATEVRARL